MTERIDQELELLRSVFPELEYSREAQWVRLPRYPMPEIWKPAEVAVAFQFPAAFPGQKPYGFHICPTPSLISGADVQNVTPSVEPPWPGPWLKFSWDVPEWAPAEEVRLGSNMLNFVLTIVDRLRAGA